MRYNAQKCKGIVFMPEFTQRIVAVLNEKIEPGRALNALGHLALGMGAILGSETLHLMDYADADGGHHPNISKMPFVILKANSNKIRSLREQANISGINFNDFTETMTVGSWSDQLAKTADTKNENLTYFGILLYGPAEVVTGLTRKFSLWK